MRRNWQRSQRGLLRDGKRVRGYVLGFTETVRRLGSSACSGGREHGSARRWVELELPKLNEVITTVSA